MDLSVLVSGGLVGFAQNAIGITLRPYDTYRRIAKTRNRWELLAIGGLLLAYFATASIVKTAAFRPYLLTKQFVVLGSGAASTYLFVSALLWAVGRRFGGVGEFTGFAIAWAYTLMPTVLWFWATSILYVVLPPPRTTSTQGVLFSLFYLGFSATLLYWKIILSYLALRFSLRMDLRQILLTVLVSSPAILLYGIFMYKMHIFKIPFI
jgi:hypothetical protein